MEPLKVERDLQSLRRLYSLLQSNTNNEYTPQPVLLDENTQFLLKRLLDTATDELLARQFKILAQVQFGLPTKNSVSRGIIKLPSKAGLKQEVLDSIERIETQLSAFRFCSTRVDSHDDRTVSCKSPSVLMEPRQSYQASVSGLRMPARKQMSGTQNIRHDPTLALQSHGSSCPDDDQIVLVRSRPPLPPPPVRSVGFEKPKQSNRTSSMKPTLLDQGTETWDDESGTSSEDEEHVSYTDQESGSTTGSSWETHLTETDSSYPSESDDDDENSQVKRQKVTGRFKRLKDKLGKVFHHHHHHHYYHHNHEEGRKPSAWKRLVKTHLQKDKEKLVERMMKSGTNGLDTRKNKGGQFHKLVEGLMRHRKRESKKKKQSHGRKMKLWQTPKGKGGVKFTNGRRVKLGKTNYLCNNKDQEHEETYQGCGGLVAEKLGE